MSRSTAASIVGLGPTWLNRRQIGLKNPLGTNSLIYEQIYSNILPYGCWDHPSNNSYTSVHGGVFCLEFSPEGSLLVAACEKQSVLVFDPLTQKRIYTVENAHLDCVNCVRFLDSKSFATCSDDYTVALWDTRNLSQKVRSLKGHSNWVKNIEYSPQDSLLVTSGFDGSVLTWEMNKYREDGVAYKKVFSTNGLMRTRLTPDGTKMIICTTGGYLIIIHNLNLNTMSQDLDGFKPNMYRLMQLSQTILPVASDFTHLFRGHGKRNRVEFITDFPEDDDAEVISSLQIHPDGHSAVSRNVSNNEKSEWSCIHNIEERLSSDESDISDDELDENDECKPIKWPGSSSCISTIPSHIIQPSVEQYGGASSSSANNAISNQEGRGITVASSDVWEAVVPIQEARILRQTDSDSISSLDNSLNRRVQSRPVFVTRVSNMSYVREDGHRSIRVSRVPVFQRNLSIRRNYQRYLTPLARHLRNSSKNKLMVRQRYDSLYRRSLVGQYDRTSILRKPIYNSGPCESKFKKFKRNLHSATNDNELNESNQDQIPTISRTSTSSHSEPCSSRSCQNGTAYSVSPQVFSKAAVIKPASTSASEKLSSSSATNSSENSTSMLSNVSSNGDEGTKQPNTSEVERRQKQDNSHSSLSYRTDLVNGERGSIESGMQVTNDSAQYSLDGRINLTDASEGDHEVSVPVTSFSQRETSSSANGLRSRSLNTRYRGSFNKRAPKNFKGNNDIDIAKSRKNNECVAPEKKHPIQRINKRIHQNITRLTHYVEEPNLGRGFIKELCVSPDGRIICSPFGNGIRLLSFSPSVQDIFHCYPGSPIPLHELTLNIAHTDIVVSTKFSPFHNLLVSGCLSGKIVYYQPFL